MSEVVINFEKDHLVIFKDEEGNFHHFEWYPADKVTPEELDVKISEYNKKTAEKVSGYFNTVEKVTDKLIREICAYKKKARPFDTLEENWTELKKEIEKAQDYLQTALSALGHIGGDE